MTSSLRVLILEDCQADGELIEETLTRDGLSCGYTLARDRREYLAALEHGPWDVILADYRLPQFDGMEALRLAREKCAQTPFLFVSGTLGEDKAVEALKNGATDYVMKDRLEKLPVAVRRALTQARDHEQTRLLHAQNLHQAKLLRQANIELERRVQERTRELTLINKELESFTHAVSHDLRAPLHGINGWCQILAKDYGAQLDAQGRGYLNTIRGETQRLEELIDALLQLSRACRGAMRLTTVNLSQLAQEAAALLRQAEPARTVDLLIQPDMTVWGDAVLLGAVVENLLSNAWKFTSKRSPARVEFGVRVENNESVYFVRDNGAGFDMAYVAKLFTPFQRLHRQDEYPGTGIGLATVERIIHRHGGRVWAQGAVNQGATLCFTVPIRKEDCAPTE